MNLAIKEKTKYGRIERQEPTSRQHERLQAGVAAIQKRREESITTEDEENVRQQNSRWLEVKTLDELLQDDETSENPTQDCPETMNRDCSSAGRQRWVMKVSGSDASVLPALPVLSFFQSG